MFFFTSIYVECYPKVVLFWVSCNALNYVEWLVLFVLVLGFFVGLVRE